MFPRERFSMRTTPSESTAHGVPAHGVVKLILSDHFFVVFVNPVLLYSTFNEIDEDVRLVTSHLRH